MRTVRIANAKNNLSRHLEYVRRGGRVRILDRNTPVADLVPIEPAQAGSDDDALLTNLEQRGLIRRGSSGPIPRDLLRPGPGRGKARVVAALLQERRGGR